MDHGSSPTPALDLSALAPAHHEQENILPLVEQVEAAIAPLGLRWEFVIVDDGSTDATSAKLVEAMATRPWLRAFRVLDTPPGRGMGLSAAFAAGVAQCRGEMIASLDSDLQNDPKDFPRMIERLRAEGLDLVQGGRKFRSWVLGDEVKDTACSLRVMRRELALTIPFHFKGMHRFVAFYARLMGYKVAEQPVDHHPRVAGEAKYGIWNRALPGLIDLFAVRWMRNRLRPGRCEEIH